MNNSSNGSFVYFMFITQSSLPFYEVFAYNDLQFFFDKNDKKKHKHLWAEGASEWYQKEQGYRQSIKKIRKNDRKRANL